MIDAKIIVEAAIQNADKYNPCRSTLDREEACRASFEDGVEWLKQVIWHERDEEPTEEGVILRHRVFNGENIVTSIDWKDYKREVSEETKKFFNVPQEVIDKSLLDLWKEHAYFDKWCYLTDLLPKGGDK